MTGKVAVHSLIHSFALAHGVTSLLLFHTSVGDGVALTMLTIAMVVSVSYRYDYPLDVTAILALLCCFAGFYLGTAGAQLIMEYLQALSEFAHQVTTVLVTELLGWATFFIVRKNKKKHETKNRKDAE
jgi:NhaP-type Na+/H+ or K+/H+ antiporter